MKAILLLFVCGLYFCACSQQQKPATDPADIKAGGPCEGCEAIYESPQPFTRLNEVDTLPDFASAGPKMVISGIIYKADGKTPAPGVVLYIYHTDQAGYYPKKENEKGWAKRHGYLRGWVRTNDKGEYRFCTLRPASYPGGKAPQHIHPVLKEPGISEYYIDEYLFDDDPNLADAERKRQELRGGSGIIVLTEKNGILYGVRNIILGKNIPGYPK